MKVPPGITATAEALQKSAAAYREMSERMKTIIAPVSAMKATYHLWDVPPIGEMVLPSEAPKERQDDIKDKELAVEEKVPVPVPEGEAAVIESQNDDVQNE